MKTISEVLGRMGVENEYVEVPGARCSILVSGLPGDAMMTVTSDDRGCTSAVVHDPSMVPPSPPDDMFWVDLLRLCDVAGVVPVAEVDNGSLIIGYCKGLSSLTPASIAGCFDHMHQVVTSVRAGIGSRSGG